MEKTSKVVTTITEVLPDGTYERIGTDFTYKREIVWQNVLVFVVLHVIGVIGSVMYLTSIQFKTILWCAFLGYTSGLGITIGAHRLYAHKTFKATLPVRFVAICLQTIAGQNSMHEWVRDHRLHHKYSDTDADPHNVNRGFFFSHVGWLLSKKHPMVKSKGKGLDMSDLEADKLVMFQKKYYTYLYILMAILLPIAVPVHFWNEDLVCSIMVSYLARYILSLHATWCVNSVAHTFGTKPFDKTLVPVESPFVSIITAGEGWHNYHHSFPWDYKASEFGIKYNMSAKLIELLASLNLAYDLKTAPREMIRSRATKKGDGSHPVYGVGKAEGETTTRKYVEIMEHSASSSKVCF